jgi:hypothetical protein
VFKVVSCSPLVVGSRAELVVYDPDYTLRAKYIRTSVIKEVQVSKDVTRIITVSDSVYDIGEFPEDGQNG